MCARVSHMQQAMCVWQQRLVICHTAHSSAILHLQSTSRMCRAVLCCAGAPPPMQEEQAKRAARAKKFGLPEDRAAPLQYAPDPEDLKRAQRAKKFGSTYEPPSADTLLQKAGGWVHRRKG
jgi:hypothetical protein